MSKCKDCGKDAGDNERCLSCRKKMYKRLGLLQRTFREDLTQEGIDEVLEDLGRG
jgi:DNA-directed RNA polymerase subunit N (RpoN/RPB10)